MTRSRVTGPAVALVRGGKRPDMARMRHDHPSAARCTDTRVAPVVDTIHGESFTDPYRWLEDQAAPDTRSWLDGPGRLRRADPAA